MLIRLVGHYIDNPARIDKLICIKGLPDEWFYRTSRFGGKELIKPWEPDVEANIPKDCRHLCDPVQITQVFAPVEKGREYTIDHITVSALRFDYMTEQGQTMWDQIERYLERTIPRDQLVPKPVLVAPDHKSQYALHEARRTVRGSLELRQVESVPVIDCRPPVAAAPILFPAAQPPTVTFVPAPVVSPAVEKKPEKFTCEQCTKSFDKQNGLRMHKMKVHAVKEPIGV